MNNFIRLLTDKLKLWLIAIVYFTVAIIYHTQLTHTVFSEWLYYTQELYLILLLSIFIYKLVRNSNPNKHISNTDVSVSLMSICYYKAVKWAMVSLGACLAQGDVSKLHEYNLEILPSLIIVLVLMFLSLFIRYIIKNCKDKVG